MKIKPRTKNKINFKNIAPLIFISDIYLAPQLEQILLSS